MKESLFTFEDLKPGIQQVTLNVGALYPEERQRKTFEENLSEFLSSDPVHSSIFKWAGDTVTYRTECIIPTRRDQRPALLLVFGNPASHSVDSEMFFAFEGKRREHRFWRILGKAHFLSFSSIVNVDCVDERNRLRKKDLYQLSYDSPFRIGLAVYYTMPSPASGSWAGVKGLLRLFGKEALAKIGEQEKSRIAQIIREFVSPNGAVIAFQKDAYVALKSSTSPDYALDKAMEGSLIGNCQCEPYVRLFCLPPTRLLQGKLALLGEFRKRILEVGEESL